MLLQDGTRFVSCEWQWEDEEMLAVGIERLARVIRRMQGEADTMSDYDIKMQVTDSAKEFW
jgi:hypothetical protein